MDSITIQGVYESTVWKYLQGAILPCDPATSAIICRIQEELDYYLGGQGFFVVYFTDMAVNTKDDEEPTTGYQNRKYVVWESRVSTIYFLVNHVEISSDVGWFVKDESRDQTPISNMKRFWKLLLLLLQMSC